MDYQYRNKSREFDEVEFSRIFLDGTLDDIRKFLERDDFEIEELLRHYWLICDRKIKSDSISRVELLLKDPRFRMTQYAISLPIAYNHIDLAKYIIESTGAYIRGAEAAKQYGNKEILDYCASKTYIEGYRY